MLDFKGKHKEIEAHLREIEEQLAEPDVVKDQNRYRELSRNHSELNEVVQAFELCEKLNRRLEEAEEMINESDPELSEMARVEAEETRVDLDAAREKLQVLLLPGDPRDARNTIVEIRAGTGGAEAGLFVGDLFRMYNLYAERIGWKVELISASPTDLGGFKEVIFLISGDQVFSRLKYEGGTHRVQRVPATETQGRIHTSAVTVAVMPEAEEVDIEIHENDLRIDVFRSSGPGGQSVNTTDSAVRITHVPTGLVVSQQDEKSQHKNRAKAMKVLRARLFDLEERKHHERIAAERKDQVGTGDRSGRIRTYNFPQNRLTDHRIGLTLYSLEQIMQGALEPVVEALATHYQTEALKNL